MAVSNDKAGSPLHPSKNTLTQQLAELDNKLYGLVCCHHFHHSVMQAFAEQLDRECPPDNNWRYGLFLVDDWLHTTGLETLSLLSAIKDQTEYRTTDNT